MNLPPKRSLKTTRYDEAARAPIHLDKGAEMGRFKLGSTVILLFGPDQVRWAEDLAALTPVRMGESLGQSKPVAPPVAVEAEPTAEPPHQ